MVKSETCRGENDGIIEIVNIGGQSDVSYMLDGQTINVPRIDNLPSGTYTIIVTDKLGCTSNREIIIDQGSEIAVDLGSDIEINTIDTTLQLSADILSGTSSKTTWFVDGIEYGNGENPIDFTATGDHTIKVIIEDENGCISEDILQILFRLNTDIFIPNTFSPNGDGINDWFEVFTKDGNNFDIKMTVYDRWGNLVYQSIKGEKPKWNGRFKGKNLPAAVYVYIIEFNDANGKIMHKVGDVTLLR